MFKKTKLVHPHTGLKIGAKIKLSIKKQPIEIIYDNGLKIKDEEYIKDILKQSKN